MTENRVPADADVRRHPRPGPLAVAAAQDFEERFVVPEGFGGYGTGEQARRHSLGREDLGDDPDAVNSTVSLALIGRKSLGYRSLSAVGCR